MPRNNTTATPETIGPGGYVRDVIDGEIGFVASIQDDGYAVIWPGDVTPKYVAADEVVAASADDITTPAPTTTSAPSTATEPHNIDVFSSGGGSDGPRRHIPYCLTCDVALAGVVYDYDEALNVCTDHRVPGWRDHLRTRTAESGRTR